MNGGLLAGTFSKRKPKILKRRLVDDLIVQFMGKILSNNEEILDAIIAGLSEVARIVAAMPAKDVEKALKAAESSYRKSALTLGYSEGQAEGWVATVMVALRAEVKKQNAGE